MVALESDFSEAETLSVSCTRFVDEGSGREAAAPEVVPPRLFLQPGGSGEVRVKVMTTAPEFEAGHTYTAFVHIAGRTTKTLRLQLRVLPPKGR